MAQQESLTSGDSDVNIEQKTLSLLHSIVKKGNASKLTKIIGSSVDVLEPSQILRCHVGADIVENVAIPHPSIAKAAVAPYSRLVVRSPTLLAAAIIHDQDGMVNELAKLASSAPLGEGANTLLDIGNDVYEINYKGEVEWRATAITPLMIACMLDKQKCVERLLLAGADPNAKSSLGRTALHEACFQGNFNTANLCISHGSKLNIAEHDGVTPLMLSCARAADDLMKFLLSKGADTRQKDALGRNALFYTLSSAPVDTARQLIKADRNCYVRDDEGCGAFLAACKQERLDMVKFLIEEADILGLKYSNTKTDTIINERDHLSRNGLHIAAEIGSKELYLELISSGISCEPDNEGRSPLMTACLVGKIEFVDFLIRQNPGCITDKLQRDLKGRNSIFYAVTAGNNALIEYLADNGVPFETTHSGLTPLMQAAGKGKANVIKFLMEKKQRFGVDINAYDNDGWNSAMFAASVGSLEALEELVASDIELRLTSDGRTVLMESAYHGQVDMTAFVLDVMRQRNIRPDSPGGFEHCDVEGWNAVNYALVAPDGDSSIQLLKLLHSRANITPATTKTGVTAIMEVALKGSVPVVSYLLENCSDYSLNLLATDNDGANAMNYAALGGSTFVFDALYAKGVPCVEDLSGRTVLMLAAARGHVDLVNHILKNAPTFVINVCACDKDGRNVLFYACNSGLTNVIETLLTSSYEIPLVRDSIGVSILMATAENGNLELFNWLISNDNVGQQLKLNDVEQNGRNVLFYALKSRNADLIEKVVFDENLTCQLAEIPSESSSIVCKFTQRLICDKNEPKLNKFFAKFTSPSLPLNAADDTGQSTLYYLVAENRLDLLENYAKFYDPTLARVSHRHGITLLMNACASSLVDVVRLLLKTASNRQLLLNAEDGQGRTALTYGVVSHNVTIVRMLIEHGAKLTVDKNGHSAVTYAIQARNLQLSLLLLTSVLEIGHEIGRTRDAEGNQLLHYCARHGGNEDLVKLIVNRTGADVNARTASGNKTALMVAATSGHVPVTRALIKAGCSVTACDTDGKTVLHLLFETKENNKHRRRKLPILTLTSLLLSTPGASFLISEQDRTGKTALMLACLNGHFEAAFMLLENGAQIDVRDVEGKDAIDYCVSLHFSDDCKSQSRQDNEQPGEFFREFLWLVKQPSRQAAEVLENFKDDIYLALTADDQEEAEDDDDKETARVTSSDLIELASSHYQQNKNVGGGGHHCLVRSKSHLYDDVAFNKICNALDADSDFRHIGAILRSELYKATFTNETYV